MWTKRVLSFLYRLPSLFLYYFVWQVYYLFDYLITSCPSKIIFLKHTHHTLTNVVTLLPAREQNWLLIMGSNDFDFFSGRRSMEHWAKKYAHQRNSLPYLILLFFLHSSCHFFTERFYCYLHFFDLQNMSLSKLKLNWINRSFHMNHCQWKQKKKLYFKR